MSEKNLKRKWDVLEYEPESDAYDIFEYESDEEYYIEPPQKKPWGKPINDIKDLIDFAEYRDDNSRELFNIIPFLKQLDEMIGMKKLKQSIIDFILYHTKFPRSEDYLHMQFVGPPGCGKTCVAKIIGKLVAELGILETDNFFILKRTDFIAGFLGQTSIKTEKTLSKCIQGVAFLDEAYSMGSNTKGDIYSKEALDYLNQFLSEHKNDFLFILAGYENELQESFFNVNPGLESRFSWKFIIEPYTPEELYQICLKMIKDQNMEIQGIEETFFKNNMEHFQSFGRDVETFITKCKFYNIRRTFMDRSGEEKIVLNKQDFNEGLKRHIEHRGNKKKQIVYGMYI